MLVGWLDRQPVETFTAVLLLLAAVL